MSRDESVRAASRNPALNVEIDLIPERIAKIKILKFKIAQYENELKNMRSLLERLEGDSE